MVSPSLCFGNIWHSWHEELTEKTGWQKSQEEWKAEGINGTRNV